MTTAAPPTITPPASFEDAMTELSTIVQALESGTVSLEASIAAYERGVALKTFCESQLNQAKMRIDQVVKNAEGAVTLSPAAFVN